MTIQKFITYKALFFLIILSAVLIFPRLGENVLQVDEGSDSFYSLTILKEGYPAISDGVNAFGHSIAVDGIWKQQPWFPFYVRALSLALFGQNSFAARLPSALSGIFSVFLLYFLSLKITGSKKEAFIATLLFTCSVPLLLYFRTARYIAFQVPLTLLVVWFYVQMIEWKKNSTVGFVVSSVLLFHTMYVVCAGVLAGIILHLLMFERSKTRVKQFFTPYLLIFFLTAPWILYIYPVFERVNSNYVFMTGVPYKISLFSLIKRFGAFIFQINNYIFPLVLLLFIPKNFYEKDFLLKHKEFVLIAIIITSTIGVSTLNYIPLQQYIAGILPFFYIFTSLVLCRLRFFQKTVIMPLIIGLLIFTNIIHVGPLLIFKGIDSLSGNKITGFFASIDYFSGPVSTLKWQAQSKSVFSLYLYEITHRYRGPLDGIVEYVNKHSSKDDTFLMNHENISFAFHTSVRQIYEIPLPEPPDWIILRKGSPVGSVLRKTIENRVGIRRKEEFYRKYIFDYIKSNNYNKIILDYPAQYGNNAFEIQIHHFKTPESDSNVVIYHYPKKKNTEITPDS